MIINVSLYRKRCDVAQIKFTSNYEKHIRFFHSSLSDTTICCQVKAMMDLKMLAVKQWTTKYQTLLTTGSVRIIVL